MATARQIVLRIQGEVCKALCEGGGYEEFDVLNEYRNFLAKRMPGQVLTDWLSDVVVLQRHGQTWSLDQPWPMDHLGEETVEEVIEEEDKDSTPLALISENPQGIVLESPPYWVSVARTGFRRLHRWKGCRVEPLECYSWKPVSGLCGDADAGVADKACKLCWPPEEGIPLSGQDSESNSSSGSSSDSTDSSAEETQIVGPGVEGELGLPGDEGFG